MRSRPQRVNYKYLGKLLEALERVNINYEELPHDFLYMPWEAKLEFLRTRYNVDCCVRCKIPIPEDIKDPQYDLCADCGSSLRSKRIKNPRVQSLLAAHYGTRDGNKQYRKLDATLESMLRLQNLEEPTKTATSSILDLLDRRTKEPSNG